MADPTNLAPEQLRALDRLNRLLPAGGFYLARGCAAAYHIGHRRSRDLDLFSVAPFDIDRLRLSLTQHDASIEVLAATDAALQLRLEGVPIDIVSYPYPLLTVAAPGPSGFATAGLLDLATMKLSAIARRGIRRDFWDLYAIVTSSSLTLDDALDAYSKRFGRTDADIYHVLRALSYFDDAEAETVPLQGLTPALWTTIKAFFEVAAPESLKRRLAVAP